jgi:hypothetical protein
MRTFLATAHGGELEFMDHEAWRQFLIQNPGEVFINIGKNRRKKQRSDNQNAYYWGVCLQLISDHTGESTEDLHDHFRVRFLMHGERFARPKSTTSLTTAEFEDYLAKIRLFAQQDLNVFIPLPHEYLLTQAI